MKLRIRFLFVCLVLLLVLAVFIKPIILFVAKKQLQNTFSGSRVSIGNSHLKLWQVNLIDIQINKEPIYNFKIGQVQLGMFKIVLQDALINIDLGKKSFSEFQKNINTSSGKIYFFPNLLEVSNLSLSLQSKEFSVSASFSGLVKLKTKGSGLEAIDGNFNALSPGGMLTIKDSGYLENMARSSGQSLDILVESLKNYHYNSGVAKLSLERNNFIFDIFLEGETGKRNLKVTLHDFNLRRER
jgi:hypothetical protein